MKDRIKLFKGDCLECMKNIEDKSIDMILCDLPYGITQNKWDSIIPLDKLWEQYNRIIKDNGAIVLFGQTPFDKMLGNSNLKMLRYEWIWEKTQGTGFLNSKKMPLKNHENILVFYKKLPTYNPQMVDVGKGWRSGKKQEYSGYGKYTHEEGKKNTTTLRYPKSVLKFDREYGLHPTQKPVELLEYLIKTYTNEGETVLDNTMGSGSTGVACINTDRKFIGIEKDEKYFKIASERIEKAYKKKKQ